MIASAVVVVLGVFTLAGALMVSLGTAPTAAADVPHVKAFILEAIQADSEHAILPSGAKAGHMDAATQDAVQNNIRNRHRQYWGGAMLTKRLNSDLIWARSAAKGPVIHTLAAKVSDVTIASLTVEGDFATVTGSYRIYHKDAEPVDSAGHELVAAYTNTMAFNATMDRSSGRWLLTEWSAEMLDATEDVSARSGDQYLPTDQTKPTMPPFIPAPANP
jgi:hypothetical protein